MNEEKIQESTQEEAKKNESKQEALKWRQIIIETDGSNIRITKAEAFSNLELEGILRKILKQFEK